MGVSSSKSGNKSKLPFFILTVVLVIVVDVVVLVRLESLMVFCTSEAEGVGREEVKGEEEASFSTLRLGAEVRAVEVEGGEE